MAGDKAKAETLRTIKSALLNEAISRRRPRHAAYATSRSKKSWPAKPKNGSRPPSYTTRAAPKSAPTAELAEKAIIDTYLPQQLGEDEVAKIVDEEIAKAGSPTMQDMGRVIGAVRARAGGTPTAPYRQTGKREAQPMIIILVLPGPGKTTQTSLLAEYLDCPWFSMGELIRQQANGQDRQECWPARSSATKSPWISLIRLWRRSTPREEVVLRATPAVYPRPSGGWNRSSRPV